MDNLGSEVGQKMRSAVKAKLIELGTGSLSGYIDDELPDYVMIMIANKRSKQQMISDLELFLGAQTELFVTWLHEVLHKLQEVTLPAIVVQKSKRKSDESETLSIVTKKEKKDKKKEKSKSKKIVDQTEKSVTELTSTSDTVNTDENLEKTAVEQPSSISDVVADHLLQKARKSLKTESVMIKIKKSETSSSICATSIALGCTTTSISNRDDFDIPTITEISESVEEIQRKKDLEELAKIQKKIDQAKSKHKSLNKRESCNEDEDEDYLNIKADGEDLDEDGTVRNKTEKQSETTKKTRNPIVFDLNDDKPRSSSSRTKRTEDKPLESGKFYDDRNKKRVPITFLPTHNRKDSEEDRILSRRTGEVQKHTITGAKKKSIHERLGIHPKHVSSNVSVRERSRTRSSERNVENLTAHNRNEKVAGNSGRSEKRSTDINRVKSRISISKEKNPIVSDDDDDVIEANDDSDSAIRNQKLVSRVVVAPIKRFFEENTDDDGNDKDNDKVVSSMIKVKPRPAIPPNKQASKNLLLRAVAEAQKSIALVQPKKEASTILLREKSPKRLQQQQQGKLYTKTYSRRNQGNNSGGVNSLKKITKDNIIIEIKSNRISNRNNLSIQDDKDDVEKFNIVNSDDEYVPEPIYDRGDSDNDYIYIPQSINFDENVDEDMTEGYKDNLPHNSTQFVVTLDDKIRKKYTAVGNRNRDFDNDRLNGFERNARQKASSSSKNLSVPQPLNKNYKKSSTASNSASYDEDSSNMSQPNDESSHYNQQQHHYHQKQQQLQQKQQQYHHSHSERNIYRDNSTSKSKKPIKKIIIKNDSDDDEDSPTKEFKTKENYDRSHTPPLPPTLATTSNVATLTDSTSMKLSPTKSSATKRKKSPIKFDIEESNSNKNLKLSEKEDNKTNLKNSSSSSSLNDNRDVENNTQQKKSIRKIESTKKYENIPEFLSAITVETTTTTKPKVKERCKYYPSCGKGDSCEYYHPTTMCKAFPNCKFVEKCLYIHPKCKYDLTCNRINCNFSHSTSAVATTNIAPPLSSHVVPVQNYKSVSVTPLPAICKYYPNCTNTLCTFYHPKLCRFGKNCMNKVECNFYHFDLPVKDKFKWVASNG